MYKRVFFIALVPDQKSGVKRHTLYLFNKEEKIVLPVEFRNNEAFMFLTGKLPVNKACPHFYILFKNLISEFGAKLVSITITECEQELFYAQLNLVLKDKHLKIPLRFTDAFVISRLFDTPLYSDHKVLEENGIKITKEILRDAMREDFLS